MKRLLAQKPVESLRWLGSEAMYLDTPNVTTCGHVTIGRYGGRTSSGAHKNEDGAFLCCAGNSSWEFAALIDGHTTAQSTELLVNLFADMQETVNSLMRQPVATAFPALQQQIHQALSAPAFVKRCRSLQGEASCLVCARKEQFLWWLCIGDCVVYLLHPDLARLGQFALNRRSFFEWVGHVNTFDLPIPCYATGTRQLRPGRNRILMLTDGLLEFGQHPFENPWYLYDHFTQKRQVGPLDLRPLARDSLTRVHEEGGLDSATLLLWDCETPQATS
ncbi:protein phosphatase [Ktedonobacter sp. SOSP1-52]|uniref:protein phosphatase 2C domain-containing protein n=1 Tax=Ktedonobacter sp. SOSP1-52 TaxID=2778366 RepID=UPI001916C712|nr:protein phosphatase 2C domain-containing protein [Ktedonobacter sp. SOSP1-52]GHO68967.1 protein phosphatase [Ktedonobacter sp. SOSP1-52]